MAVIGNIRNRGKLIAGVVFFALALFVVGALLEHPGRGGRGEESIGEINGQDISAKDFGDRVDQEAEYYRTNGTPVDDQMREQIRNTVWNELLKEHTLMTQVHEAGLGDELSKEELDDQRWGENIAPMFKNDKSIQDPATGKPDPKRLKQALAYLQQNDNGRYHRIMKQIVTDRLYAKYNTLVKKSCFVNSAQAKDDFAAKNTKASFNFVAKRFDAVPDSLYPVKDEDVQRYFAAHSGEKKWKQTAARSFVYVRFNATPTAEDIAATRDDLAGLKKDLEDTKGAKADSAFVMAYSTTKNPKPTPYAEGSADHLNDSLIVHADTGAVVGPYKDGDFWKLVKVAELADVSEARVRHILFNTQGKSDDEQARVKARADSVLAVVKRDRSKFEAMVTKFSEDPGSKNSGGVYEWFDRNRMVPEFTKASFDEKVGAITICKTSYGYHIVEVLGQRTRKERRVLTVDEKVKPERALKEAYRLANEFSINNTDSASFHKTANERSIPYTPVDELHPDQRYLSGLQDAAGVISFVNHAKLGDKPSGPIVSEESYVVCLLTGIREEGAPQLKDVKDAMTREVRKEMKADALVAKMKGKSDLSALASELGVSMSNANDIPYASYNLPGGYNDPEAIGGIFAVQSGATSDPLKGDMGVYVVKMDSVAAAPEMPAGGDDLKAITDRVRSRAEYSAFNALKEMANVKDERNKIF